VSSQDEKTHDENIHKEIWASVATAEGRRKFLRELRTLLPVGAVLGTALMALVALGQVLGMGLGPAWRAYWMLWVGAPLIGIVALSALLAFAMIVGLTLGTLFALLTRLLRGTVGRVVPAAKTWTLTGGGVVILFMLFVAVSQIVRISYSAAQKRLPKLEGTAATAVAQTASALNAQKQATTQLSDSARQLITGLDQTLSQIEDAKRQLTATLAAVDAQRDAIARTEAQLKQLDEQRTDLELTTAELRRYLGGKDPITKDDLDRSGWVGLAWGVLLGFAGNIAATALYEKIKQRVSKNSPQ
jgi:hypothetical protein